jgi:membrane protein DedA with SNARE-associated domain/membrane-associated phospholipid phosphatase
MSRVWAALRAHPGVIVVVLLAVAYFLFRDEFPSINAEELLNDLADSLGQWTYVLVSVLAFLETGAFVGLVFPGETAVIIAGAIAGQGETSIVITIALVWFSAWAGDSVSFYIGTRLGRDFILRHGHRVRITPERFAQVEDYFSRHGGKTILVGRFLGLVRALAPFIAGSSGMRYRAFLPYSVLGTGLWAATFSLLGFVLAENIDLAEEIAGRGIFVFGTVVVVVVGTILAVRYMRVHENRAKLVARLDESRLGRPVVALGRRIEPQARFLWNRLTPGNLGLEFTSVMAVLAVALFIVIGFGVVVHEDPGPTRGDETAFEVAADLNSGWFTDVNEEVTKLGSATATLAVAIVAAAWLGFGRRWPELAVLVGGVALAHLAVPILKDALERPRPPGELVEVGGYSWPSGHAAYAIIYPWLAITAATRVRSRLTHGTALVVAGILLAAAIGLSRVYLRIHFLSDVNSGAALGVASFALCAAVALVVMHFRNNAVTRE